MPVLKNPKHERFVQAYLRGPTAGNAAASHNEATGRKSHRARQDGYKWLRRGDIVARLTELRAEIEKTEHKAIERAAEAVGITKEWVLERLRENVERCMQRVAVLDADGEPIGQWKFEPAAANKALELLGRHVGLFMTGGDTINNILQVGAVVIDRPPAETFKQWQERRLLELKPHTNGRANGNGKAAH